MAWGERWEQKLVSSSDDAVFLIPIITPSYFASEPCRQELKQFVDRENTTGFREFILPIYYIDSPKLQDEFEKATDFLAQIVADHNYEDFRELRHRSITSFEAKQKIKKLASAFVIRLKGYARRQLSSPSMQAHFTVPPNGAKAPRKVLLSGNLEAISKGTDVWLVVETGALYHPQEQLPKENGPFRAPVIIGQASTMATICKNLLFTCLRLPKRFAGVQPLSGGFRELPADGSAVQKPADSKCTRNVEADS